MRKFLLVFLMLLPGLSFYAQTCGGYNSKQSFAPTNLSANQEHKSGSHSVLLAKLPDGITPDASGQGKCTYTHVNQHRYCDVSCEVLNKNGDVLNPLAGITVLESGTLVPILPTTHQIGVSFKGATANSANSSMSTGCTGALGAAALSCGIFNGGCTVGVSVTATSATTTSLSLTNSGGTVIWTDSTPLHQECGPKEDPEYTPPPPPPPDDPPCVIRSGGRKFTNSGNGSDEGNGSCSPIVIDTEGEGFHLTSASAGVLFDIRGDGHPVKISWTDGGFHNAFLALDRDGTGTITSGKELFGNFTEQPKSDHKNGFLALAEFDKSENGGNGDGVIDDHDAVFTKLRLWIDANHNGVADLGELHGLPELGVFSLSLNYHDSRREDQYGNEFRYKARVNPHHHDRRDDTPVGRNAFDVFFFSE